MIPLGVDGDAFVFSADERAALGIEADDLALLFLGRLSFHAKANPFPMYLELERAAAGRRVHLIQAGWFAHAGIERVFREAAARFCPSVRAVFVDGRDPDQCNRVWAAADVFTTLADNIQETFGLAPLEAMAAGLPVVVSDWDGYRETVREGVDGFRIPTLTPAPPLGTDLANRFETGADSYDSYCGGVSLVSAVDVAACAQAYSALFADRDLPMKMGACGRERVRDLFDWRVIIPQYQELWRDLAECRRADPEREPTSVPKVNPARPDPFAAFASYPTRQLSGTDTVRLAGEDQPEVLVQRWRHSLFAFAPQGLPGDEEIMAVLHQLDKTGPCK